MDKPLNEIIVHNFHNYDLKFLTALRLQKLVNKGYSTIVININDFTDLLYAAKNEEFLENESFNFEPVVTRELLQQGLYGRISNTKIKVSKDVQPNFYRIEE